MATDTTQMYQSGLSRPAHRQHALDGLRGLACLIVLFNHAGWSVVFPPLVIYGWTGVHLFFVLSGYLIAKPFLKSIATGASFPGLRDYTIRRALRIYPPFLVSMVFFFLLRVMAHRKLPDTEYLLLHASLLFNYVRHIDLFSFNAVYWSLAIEIQFYLLLPILALIVHRSGRPSFPRAWILVGIFIIGGLVCRAVESRLDLWSYPGNSITHYRTVFSFLDLFGFGMVAAVLEMSDTVKLTKRRTWRIGLTIIGFALYITANNWAFFSGKGDPQDGSGIFMTFGPAAFCAGIAMMVYCVIEGPPKRQLPWTWEPLVRVGEMSYSVYLYHLAVLVFCFTRFPFPSIHSGYARAYTYCLIGTPLTLVVSWIMYFSVERPSLALAARLTGKRVQIQRLDPVRAS